MLHVSQCDIVAMAVLAEIAAKPVCWVICRITWQDGLESLFTFTLPSFLVPAGANWYDDDNCFCSVLAFWLGSVMSIRVVLFLFPLFSSTWSSVFRLLVSVWELWHSDCCDPFLARVWSNFTSSVAPLHSISVSEMVYWLIVIIINNGNDNNNHPIFIAPHASNFFRSAVYDVGFAVSMS